MAILETRQLTKSFGGVCAVSRLDFNVQEGEIVAVIGPNGAGKTTLFNLITGVIRCDSGSINILGQAATCLPTYRIAALGVARTFQNLQIFGNMTVVENVMVGRHTRSRTSIWEAALALPWVYREERQSYRQAIEYLEVVGLAGKAADPASSLPFGQQRQLEIARAMALEPKLLFLDEPAAGLNGAETAELVQLIYRLRSGGATIVLVEHDMATVMEVADRIIVLDYGEKIAEGTPGEIQQDPHVIAAYLGEEVD